MNETLEKYKWWIVLVVLLLALGIWFFTRPTYDDVYTPKPLLSNPLATVRIVEFSDFQCPACGAAYPVVKQIIQEYGNKVSLEYKHFPLTSIHRFAFSSAEASECANDQGKFWEYYALLFENQDALSDDALKQYAVDLGLDTILFDNCLDSNAKAKYVTADFNEGIGKGVDSTPTFFINDVKLESWRYESFAAKIDDTLNEG